jgi:hypothetical protein
MSIHTKKIGTINANATAAAISSREIGARSAEVAEFIGEHLLWNGFVHRLVPARRVSVMSIS